MTRNLRRQGVSVVRGRTKPGRCDRDGSKAADGLYIIRRGISQNYNPRPGSAIVFHDKQRNLCIRWRIGVVTLFATIIAL